LLSADADFVRLFAQGTHYRPLGSTTLVASVRAGAIESGKPCDETTGPSCAPNLTVPIVERFFAGGRTSHRAFALDQLGIPGQTVNEQGEAFGGNAVLVANVEWRVPLYGELRGSVFLDAGNVWSDWRRVSLPALRWGAGLGLSYMTPVGPVRLEYGFKLDKKPGESAGQLHFSVGYPF
jgi:outer membrane protein insertion porin family